MYRVDQHKNIYLSRGDDFSYTFPVYVDNSETAYKFEKNDGCMLFFYIFIPNSINYEFVMKKTFGTDGSVITEFSNDKASTTKVINNIDDKENIIVTLTEEDTMKIFPGQYKYQIRVKVKDSAGNLVLKTVTNRKDFYVIEDDYSNRIW